MINQLNYLPLYDEKGENRNTTTKKKYRKLLMKITRKIYISVGCVCFVVVLFI